MNFNHARLIATKVADNVDLVANLIVCFANVQSEELVDHLCTIAVDPVNADMHDMNDIDKDKITDAINKKLNNTIDNIPKSITIKIDNLLMTVNVTGTCIRNGYFRNEEKAKEGMYWNAEDTVSDHNPVYAKYKYDFNCTFDFKDDIWK